MQHITVCNRAGHGTSLERPRQRHHDGYSTLLENLTDDAIAWLYFRPFPSI